MTIREDVQIGPQRLAGTMEAPPQARALVIFAHGSGSSRASPRNRRVATRLHERGLATLLFDLLTEAEASDRRNVFDVALLARRLGGAIIWARAQPESATLPYGLFGASTGAAAALLAAVEHAADVRAIVSRGGRPDLAADALPRVTAPTLLIVGGDDTQVLALNRWAFERLACVKRLAVVPRATHLFEEPGALENVATLAADWFAEHLRPEEPADE
jgi:pimeloyl-ACP methyl ester carboxylesterase